MFHCAPEYIARLESIKNAPNILTGINEQDNLRACRILMLRREFVSCCHQMCCSSTFKLFASWEMAQKRPQQELTACNCDELVYLRHAYPAWYILNISSFHSRSLSAEHGSIRKASQVATFGEWGSLLHLKSSTGKDYKEEIWGLAGLKLALSF